MLNETIVLWFFGIVIWTGVGVLLLFVLYSIADTPVQKARGLEFVNPMWIYDNYNVNVFGAFVLSTFFAALCPAIALGYWIYKICTYRRQNNGTR